MSKPKHGRFVRVGQGHGAVLARNREPTVMEPEQTDRGRVVDLVLGGCQIVATVARPREPVLP